MPATWDLPEITLAYVCTAERMLSELGIFFTIDRVAVRSDTGDAMQPAVSMDSTALHARLGDDEAAEILRQGEELSTRRAIKNGRSGINAQQLRFLIEDLEVQLSYLCRR